MKLNTGIGWAAVNKWGDIIHIARTRAEVIAYAARVYDRQAYEAAHERAKRGNVFFRHKPGPEDRKAWKMLRRKYDLRAVKIQAVELID
ncbi:MAG: hypothetical protein AAF066_11225 [Pseudomonadota bacterium]